MNRIWKAVAIGAITASAGVVVGAFGAGVALAHHNTMSGQSTCQTDGTYKIVWSITNSEGISEDVKRTSSNDGTFSVDFVHPNFLTITSHQTATVTQSNIPGTKTGQTLSVSARWSNGNTQTTPAPSRWAATARSRSRQRFPRSSAARRAA